MNEKLDSAMTTLALGVQELRNTTGWRTWLDMASKMHDYSLNNQLLIMMQRPDATSVAGYNRWKTLGRHVNTGETSIRILAPCTRKIAVLNPDHTPRINTDTGKTVTRNQVVGYRAVSVFDVSQTEGEPLPEMPHPLLLEGQAPLGLWEALAEQVHAAGFELSRAENATTIGGANGVTDYASRSVRVRADISDAQAAKTLAHELGHVLLHDPDGSSSKVQCRGEKEVEAESVAYLVASHTGLDTSDYTFGYIAGWATTTEDDVLATVADRIRKAALSITHKLDATMEASDSPVALGLPWTSGIRTEVAKPLESRPLAM